MADLTYYNDQELPVATFDWSNAGEDFSTGWTFTVRLCRTTARATTLLLKSTGITSSATTVTVAWSTTDWSGLEAADTGTDYFCYLYARRTADSKDIEFRPDQPITLKLKAAPGTSAVSPSSYPITVTAASVTVADTAGYYTASNVENVLAELPDRFGARFTPSLLPAPTVMASAPTVTLSAANAATGIASATSRFLAPSGVLASWWRMFGGGTPSTSTVATLSNTVGASTTWLTDPVAGTSVKGTLVIEFATDADDFEFTVACITTNTLRYRLWVDGQLQTADMSATAGLGGSYYRLRVTFSTAAPRVIRLELAGATVYSVRALPSFSLWAPGYYVGPRVVVMGDSYSEGSTGAWHHSWGWEMCHRLGWRDFYQSALGGTGYINPGSGGRVNFRNRVTNDVVATGADWVIVAGGYNDTGYTTAAVRAEAALLFAAIKAGLPNCKLVVVGPFQSNDGQLTTLRSFRDVIFAAAVGYADLTIDPTTATDSPWITGTGFVGSTASNGNADILVNTDGVHYTRAGYRYVGARVAQEIAAAFG